MTEISPPNACPLVLRCTVCAYEQSVQWDPAPPPPNPKDLERVRAAVCWRRGRPSHNEMLAMRRFIPEFRDKPMRELHAVLNGAPNWPLGSTRVPVHSAFKSKPKSLVLRLRYMKPLPDDFRRL
jgi:hypothetical protein